MAYTFDEIMAFHPDNEDVYQEIKQFLPKLVPFIGAGLTSFAYYSWPKALKTLSQKLTDSASAQKVTDLINAKDLLGAAQLLEDFRTPANLARDLAGMFSADKREQARGQLSHEPISLLPDLFPELVLTTNFDETLETVYSESGHPFQTVFLPGQPELLRQLMRQGGVCGLLKLHGTVTGGLIEYEKVVFTRAQYDRHYGKRSPLTRDLRDSFKNRMMLFLGCSLENDRTMDLLQKVIQPGDTYYTIINCTPSERDKKIRQLGNKHIRAILYEGERHEAVRVILEHLLEETNPEAYHRLPVHVGALESIDPTERFSYKAEIVPFVGRGDELNALNAFLGDAHIAFRWWAITGPGGSGKSRLAYEFQKQIPPDWAVHYIDLGDYANLSVLTSNPTQKTLLIADYVQENAKTIGKWMEQLNERNRNLPIRALLVERESNVNEIGSGWAKQLYTDVRHEHKLKNACYQENFLTLKPLGDDNLLDIIGNYALALKQNNGHPDRMLPDAIKQMLLRKLKSVDPVLCRPLYALFLTDAYVAGDNPEQWNRNDVLDYITTREQGRLKFNIKHTLGKSDEKLYATCLYLYTMATVLQDTSLDELQLLCPDTWNIIQKKAECFASPADMLEQAGLVVEGTVFALRPDLIGEYFVYTWLRDHPNEVQRFVPSVWQRPAPTAVFFDRIFHDYSYLLNEDKKHWELIRPNDIPASEKTARYYAALLVSATHHCNITEECKQQVNLLKELAAEHRDVPDIAIRFANGLVNLSSKQDEQGARETIARLECLADEHRDVPDIVFAHAIGLVNLSGKQDEQGARETIAHLERLADEHPGVPDIVIALAKGLVNLSGKQDEQGVRETIVRLERLADEHPGVPDIIISLAKGLVNLSGKQDEQGVRETIAHLERLADEHPDVSDIAIRLANGLFNLSSKQDEQGARETIACLECLADKHSDVSDIVVELANGLVNLSSKQDEQGVRETIARLERFADEHPDVPNIVTSLAKGLFNLSVYQDEQGVRETIARLERLADEHPDVPDIAIWFAKGLVNLSSKQEGQGAQETITRLERLADEHPDVPDVVIELAKGLFNLSVYQDEQGARETIAHLERLADEHPGVPDIATCFVNGLVNLSGKQDEQGVRETIARLERLADEHPDVPDIVIALAKGLFNLSGKQGEQEARETIARLERLADEHPDVLDVVIELANGLVNLGVYQDEQGAWETIARLERLADEHPDVPDIVIDLASGLFNLSVYQDEQGVRETIACLERLADEHPDVPDIVIDLANGLVNLSSNQDEQGVRETIARLERLADEHPDMSDIIISLAKELES